MICLTEIERGWKRYRCQLQLRQEFKSVASEAAQIAFARASGLYALSLSSHNGRQITVCRSSQQVFLAPPAVIKLCDPRSLKEEKLFRAVAAFLKMRRVTAAWVSSDVSISNSKGKVFNGKITFKPFIFNMLNPGERITHLNHQSIMDLILTAVLGVVDLKQDNIGMTGSCVHLYDHDCCLTESNTLAVVIEKSSEMCYLPFFNHFIHYPPFAHYKLQPTDIEELIKRLKNCRVPLENWIHRSDAPIIRFMRARLPFMVALIRQQVETHFKSLSLTELQKRENNDSIYLKEIEMLFLDRFCDLSNGENRKFWKALRAALSEAHYPIRRERRKIAQQFVPRITYRQNNALLRRINSAIEYLEFVKSIPRSFENPEDYRLFWHNALENRFLPISDLTNFLMSRSVTNATDEELASLHACLRERIRPTPLLIWCAQFPLLANAAHLYLLLSTPNASLLPLLNRRIDLQGLAKSGIESKDLYSQFLGTVLFTEIEAAMILYKTNPRDPDAAAFLYKA